MKIFYDLNTWKQARFERPREQTLGFVPTMGNLHLGHLSLITQSQKENQDTLVSIFVNKTQFNNPEDFLNYPRTLEADLEQLENAGVRYCLVPKPEEIYLDDYRYQIHETTHPHQLEGKHRPGHFTGMLTVVMKLLQLTQPSRIYLGEKDFEQLTLIRQMVKAFFMNVDVIGCPTLRESSGLAYSSRNQRLSKQGLEKAAQFAAIFHQTASTAKTIQKLQDEDIQVEYIEEYHGRRFAAVYIENIRLIDNYAVT